MGEYDKPLYQWFPSTQIIMTQPNKIQEPFFSVNWARPNTKSIHDTKLRQIKGDHKGQNTMYMWQNSKIYRCLCAHTNTSWMGMRA